jgi:hypothetical protein
MTRLIPALLALIAFAARGYGLDFGLPLLSNLYIRPDESLVVVSAAELLARGGDPGHLNYPAFMMTALAAVFAPMTVPFGDDPSRYFLAGRVFSAVCGSALTLVVYGLARRWTPIGPAAGAALWYAVSPLAMREAHFAVTDTPLALLVTLAVWSAAHWFARPASWWAAVACGAVVGLAAGTKYNSALLAPVFGLAFLLTARGTPLVPRVGAILAMSAASVVVFFATNPSLLWRTDEVLAWFRVLAGNTYQPRPDLAMPPDVDRAARGVGLLWLLPGAWVGAALAGVGACAAIRRARQDASLWPLVAGTAGFVLLLAPARVLPLRYLAPLLPLSAVLMAMGLRALPRPPIVAAAVVAAGLVLTVPDTVRIDMSLAREDSRAEAGRWIAAHVPAGVPIVWLGQPEGEPQVIESAASIERRIQYVEALYGPIAARVIDRPYLLMQAASAAHGDHAREVYRHPALDRLPPGPVCVIWARYPLPMVRADEAQIAAWTRGRVIRQATFGEEPASPSVVLEPSDAFFLPMRLDRTYQPGPRLEVRLVDREPAS